MRVQGLRRGMNEVAVGPAHAAGEDLHDQEL